MENYFPNMNASDSQAARDRVLQDLHILVADSELLLSATMQDLGEKAVEARARLKAGLIRAKATLSEIQEKGMNSAKAAADKVDTTIRDHPYESIGVAVGVGVLVGLLLGRK